MIRRILSILIRVVVVLVAAVVLLTLAYKAIPPVSTMMLRDWVMGPGVDRRYVALDRIAPILPRTVISSEDGRFCSHRGVDWDAVSQVLDDEDGPSRGASTITMQLAKNLFLWPSRSYLRKGLEMPLAYWLDLVLGKRRVLELYLNIVEWGPGIFGAEAAAQHYFGRPASDLDARQAALLAAALPNPITRNPARPSRGVQRLAGIFQARAATAAADISCIRP